MENSRKLPCPDSLQAHWHACANAHVLPGQTLVVGLSGGMDSMALLHWLRHNVASAEHTLSALHVHHGLSSCADEWADHCQAFCAALDIPVSIVKVSVDRAATDGLESAARRARHAAFARAEGDWIVLAHHRGDQAETLLFNLLRGSGVRGAAAMRRSNGRLLRPWLAVGRDAIESYARQAGLRWIEDESNADVRHSRNFLRHQVLTTLRERFPATEERLAAASMHFAEAQELLDDLARIDLEGNAASFPVPVAVLAKLGDARAANLLAYLLRTHGVAVTSKRRLTEAMRQLVTAGPDRHPSVRFGEYHLSRRRDIIELSPQSGIGTSDIDHNESGERT